MYNISRLRSFRYYCHNFVPKTYSTSFLRSCTLCKCITSKVFSTVLDSINIQVQSVRHHSTSYNLASITSELNKRRRFRQQKKKYAELLEVLSSGSHSETKARVKNLKAKDVSLLAENPNITLEQLHELKKGSGAGKDAHLAEERFPAIIENDIVAEEHEFGETVAENEMEKTLLSADDPEPEPILPQVDTCANKEKKRSKKKQKETVREDLAKIKLNELKKSGKLESLNSVLLAYIDACVSCGFLNRALATLNFYVKRGGLHSVKPTDVRITDTLLAGFASKGKIEKFEEVWGIARGLNITPSYNSFTARLECLIRSKPRNLEMDINNTIYDMENLNYSLDGLFENSTFLGDQRNLVLEAINLVDPNYKPTVLPTDICYTCELLKHLNEKNSSNLVSATEGIMNAEIIKELVDEQLENEMKGTVVVKSVEKRAQPTTLVLAYRKKLDTMKKLWERSILQGMERDISALNSAQTNMKTNKYATLFPYLKLLDPEEYKDIIMQEIIKLAEGSESFSPTTVQLYRDLGKKVRSRYLVKFKQQQGLLEKSQLIYRNYCDWYANPNCREYLSNNSRQEWQQQVHMNQEGASVYVEEKKWPNAVLIGIGKFLYNIILHDIKIDVNCFRLLENKTNEHYLPAFYLIFRRQSNRSVEEVKPHPLLSKLLRATQQEELKFDVNLVPMLCPPMPWTSVDSGGYLVVKSDLIRLPYQAVQQNDRMREAPPNQLYPSLDALNQLGNTPWKVNSPMLDVIIEIFNSGGSAKLDIPEPPSSLPPSEPITKDMSGLERFKAYRHRIALKRKKAEMYSLWCDALYRLSLANHFRNRIFWLPHNMDFRGRVYPCPPHLNHLGSDMARSLLCFAKGKPLGPNGLDWLKTHLVNLTGLKKKESVDTRLAYANEILEDIIDSANYPLTGGRWWAESEVPWQTLACCMEIRNALAHPDGPAAYVCHFPVHQDGSCNGLQHYAALGRDQAGAQSVNLSSSQVPQDVYSCVAAIVERERANDAAKGVEVAKVLEGFIQRKVIKQTVMTTVYGVTRYGAKLQIGKQLKDIDSFPKDYIWIASLYLASKTFESLREMFTSTREIQDWFTECARLISQIRGENVEYVTPLGLPVVQPYTRHKKVGNVNLLKRLDTANEYFTVDKFERPNVMKQKNAFPPNFIHSLDSSHMMLTSLHCEQSGITYVSVHDCFWTHPCTVHIMNKICREQFVALHSEPILEDLSNFLMDKFGYSDDELSDARSKVKSTKERVNSVLQQLPHTGDFNLENVLNSTYFFS
ncbi:DNA-directed RNA polymerase, mitochondrial [Nilaparvata lugens]|uniref:DNA-directed RNA polymerase, mitochondrial n=1 Tax=Nilaparvata lugens TaxID=108931 RepID=UPI00193E6779|nr:DNA-directed RNA polymerase, mitochondrial [Nilaparvata lugens]